MVALAGVGTSIHHSSNTVNILHRMLSFTGVVTVAMALSGCLESTDVTFFEPGVYQGAADPLIGNSDEAALRARFAGQTDR